MATVRVRDGIASIVTHPVNGTQVALVTGVPFESDDIVVKTFAWAFQSDAERDVEDATAEPGRKRTTRRSS